jgi:hypothetical protein
MSSKTSVRRAIARADAILPGRPAPDAERDPRWQAIIRVGEFIESEPEAVWAFAIRWGKHGQTDLRTAVATCLVEHLLEYHFELIFPLVRQAALNSVRFADTFERCWWFGQAEYPKNARRINGWSASFARKNLISRPSGPAARSRARGRLDSVRLNDPAVTNPGFFR